MGIRNQNVHLDFLGTNEIKNVLIDVRSSDPGSPVAGQIWFNSSTGQLKYYNGTDTVVLAESTADAYAHITDGSTTANASGADTVTFAASGTGLSIAVTSNPDTVTYTLNSATSGNSKVLLTNGSGKIAASTVQEVLASTDL